MILLLLPRSSMIQYCIRHKDKRDGIKKKTRIERRKQTAKPAKQAKKEQVKKQKEEQKALKAKKRGKSPCHKGKWRWKGRRKKGWNCRRF